MGEMRAMAELPHGTVTFLRHPVFTGWIRPAVCATIIGGAAERKLK